MGKQQKTSSPEEPVSFEQALADVEKIVHDLEEGKIGLAEALHRYEQGVRLLKDCYQLLEKAERRIQLLSGVDADGNPVLAPFDDEENASLDDKSRARAKRRSSSSSPEKPQRSVQPESVQPESIQPEVDGGQSLF